MISKAEDDAQKKKLIWILIEKLSIGTEEKLDIVIANSKLLKHDIHYVE